MVRRVYVEKLSQYAHEAHHVLHNLRERMGITSLKSARLLHRYDVEGIEEKDFNRACETILSEAPVDRLSFDPPADGPDTRILAIEALPGQYDQRADSAAQAIQLMTHGAPPTVAAAGVWLLEGSLNAEDMQTIKSFLINPVEAREASLEIPASLDLDAPEPGVIPSIEGFISGDGGFLSSLRSEYGLAMSEADLALCQEYYRDTEQRNPTETEIRVLDTYWSDHCRHTTFLTRIEKVEFGTDPISQKIEESYRQYLTVKEKYAAHKSVCLMDLATIVMKQFRKEGKLDNLEVSEEINACSIRVEAEIDGKKEPWLVMFKNETHNHPTEIEPFGGAATCLGGAIRDPLSGRSYVYQAMRVTGSGDPRVPVSETIAGKLPQRTISTVAARGYSSYGNQIGLATGKVHEIYHPGYVAKRMEIGAVVGAAPENSVSRLEPAAGDLIVLIGGRTGRDGIGGATGSSKEHNLDSLAQCGAEVQKGNPPTERKLQRLFRDRDFAKKIKRCNDFGAGGVSVAVGELAPGLKINLDAVPKKYHGLNGTELAISESQERMAIVVEKENLDYFIRRSAEENLEATLIAEVTDDNRLIMEWKGTKIVDLSRDFLDTNGAEQTTSAAINGTLTGNKPFAAEAGADIREEFLKRLASLDACGQEGLGQLFDSTIGAGSVLMPYGGKNQTSPSDGMAALIPVEKGSTTTATLMSFGFDPRISSWSPYHGAVYAVLQSAARIASMGGDFRQIRLTFQEYFERLGTDPVKWGKPLSALLGAFHTQEKMGIAAIGGKDSMSGTFEDLHVPPTLVSFAVAPIEANKVISQELKKAGTSLILLTVPRDADDLPNLDSAMKIYDAVHKAADKGAVLSAKSIGPGGLGVSLAEMAFGNNLGVSLDGSWTSEELFRLSYGSLILELENTGISELAGLGAKTVGQVTDTPEIKGSGFTVSIEDALKAWRAPLEEIYPISAPAVTEITTSATAKSSSSAAKGPKTVSPRVLIPVFPGTNCEYDSAEAFHRAGGTPDIRVLRNLTPDMVADSIHSMAEGLKQSQILMIPGGFSAGDEPEGSGKFIAAFFSNPELTDAVEEFLARDGLILGICNGFQALIKLGLLPWGHIAPLKPESPTLTFNTLSAHVSRFVTTRIETTASPWLQHTSVGDTHWIPVSHGEGRFVAEPAVLMQLEKAGQIAARYVDDAGSPTMAGPANPNGSMNAVEALISPDGRILGKMGHSERYRPGLFRNIPGDKDQGLFKSGVEYFG